MQGSASFEELRNAYDESFEQLRNEVPHGERFKEAQQAYRRTRDELAHFLIVQNVGQDDILQDGCQPPPPPK